ncbi:MAG: 4Fe-4S dicluster domain-containing protein [Thermodesulfobacteriota bacterium]|nr:4Fe-4S dicluster domain-containing protein [Thermodesulfobacteriota bacterium]
MTVSAIEVAPEVASPLISEVMERSGQNLLACYQCRRCAGACSVGDETNFFTPDRLIRAILLGDRQTALNNELIWKCVSCYTCGIRCPNGIQTGRITETLKKMAKEAHLASPHPRVVHFHDAFVESGVRWGRVNETEFMAVYEMKNTAADIKKMDFAAVVAEVTRQLKLAVAMLRLGRMHFGFLSAKGRKEIKRLSKKTKTTTF